MALLDLTIKVEVMMNHSLLNIGTSAMQSGMQRASQAAAEIAGVASNNDASLTHSVVDLLQAENQVKAAAQVVKTADQLMGSIIDTFI